MNIVLGGKKPIFLFAEKPAIAPPVFVFQKDKGQKVRGQGAGMFSPHVITLIGFLPEVSPRSHGQGCFWLLSLHIELEGKRSCGFKLSW